MHSINLEYWEPADFHDHDYEIINGIKIDKTIIDFVKLLWENNITTYHSCGGGEEDLKDFIGDYESIDQFMKHIDQDNDIIKHYYTLNGKLYSKGYFIISKQDLKRFKKILIKTTLHHVGIFTVRDRGMMFDYHPVPPMEKDVVYINFRREGL